MNRKEKEQKVLDLFGLKIGDKINFIEDKVVNIKGVYEIKEEKEFILLKRIPDGFKLNINCLIDYDYEKIKVPLKDRKCKDFDSCIECPFYKSVISCTKINLSKEVPIEEYYKKAEEDFDKIRVKIYGDDQ